jgi:exonuclease V gamma subunit
MPQGRVDPSPQAIKLDLVEERRDLPNPATYFFETQLDFPFEETMLPVAKRKLMRYLSRQEGEA